MKVRDAMAKTISSASPDDTIVQAANLMKQEGCGFIPVTSEGRRLVGVVTDRDIVVRCLAAGHGDVLTETVDHVMSADPLLSVGPDEDIAQAAKLMDEREVRRLAVVDDGELIGVLSHGNLVQAVQGGDIAMQATQGVTRGA